jgi:hypothetical protein
VIGSARSELDRLSPSSHSVELAPTLQYRLVEPDIARDLRDHGPRLLHSFNALRLNSLVNFRLALPIASS